MTKKKDKVTLVCLNCGKEFLCSAWHSKTRKFCSQVCAAVYNGKTGKTGGNVCNTLDKFIEFHGVSNGTKRFNEKSRKASEQMKKRVGKNHPRYGKKMPEDLKEKSSAGLKKYTSSIKGKTFDEIYGKGARELLSKKMKGTFSLEWFIRKYGEEEGNKKYKERSGVVSAKSYFKVYNKTNKNNYSKMSQELFWEIYNSIPTLKTDSVYFAELNHECSCGLHSSNFDFSVTTRKKIIEFNGDSFHANPDMFKESDCPNPYNKFLTAKEIWEKDESKITEASLKGYDVMVVWESEYLRNRASVIKKCINFIESV